MKGLKRAFESTPKLSAAASVEEFEESLSLRDFSSFCLLLLLWWFETTAVVVVVVIAAVASGDR